MRQVGFWVIAAQAGIALSLGIPGEAVMGVVGAAFVGGTGALAFLLAAEVVAATAAVSEAALVYVARHRNLMISALMIAVQAALTILFIQGVTLLPIPPASLQAYQAASAAAALMLALGLASILKARLLCRLLDAPVQGWRWPLVWAAAAAVAVGQLFTMLPQSLEWIELAIGIPAILFTFGLVVWWKGFTHDDRVLFRIKKGEEPELPPPPGTTPPGAWPLQLVPLAPETLISRDFAEGDRALRRRLRRRSG